MNFTQKQLENWATYEKVREKGNFNMLDSRARQESGLSFDEYMFVINNYIELKHGAEENEEEE
jgi:hypothetical protein